MDAETYLHSCPLTEREEMCEKKIQGRYLPLMLWYAMCGAEVLQGMCAESEDECGVGRRERGQVRDKWGGRNREIKVDVGDEREDGPVLEIDFSTFSEPRGQTNAYF